MIVVALTLLAAAPASTTTVTVRGVARARGTVQVALCTRETFLRRCALSRSVPARSGEVSIAFPAVPAGRYAAMAFHDENGDGRMARNEMGIPTEGYGFSRNAAGRQGPPSFDDAAVTVPATGARVALDLRY